MTTKNILISSTILLVSLSCGQQKNVPESLSNIKEVVAKLDADVSSMYGWEPRDSTYNHSLDTVVSEMMDQYEAERPDVNTGERTEYAVQQQAYDEARVTWAEFKRLCDADEYEKALEVYLGEGDDYVKKNSGDFLVFLKHSTQRFVFFSQVLLPIMREYKGDTFAFNEYIDLLQLEKAMEDVSIAMSAENNGYVPEVYPYVVQELGSALVSVGKMDEAQDLFRDLIDGVYGLTDDALFANFFGTRYCAELYLQDDKPDWALATWDDFKEFLENNKSDYDPEDLAKCLERIEQEMELIASPEKLRVDSEFARPLR